MLAADTSRKLKKSETCFDKPVLSRVEGLSMNGIIAIVSSPPFVLSPSKDSERLFLQPANFCTGAKICARLGVT